MDHKLTVLLLLIAAVIVVLVLCVVGSVKPKETSLSDPLADWSDDKGRSWSWYLGHTIVWWPKGGCTSLRSMQDDGYRISPMHWHWTEFPPDWHLSITLWDKQGDAQTLGSMQKKGCRITISS